jgi:hypothetical protein
MTEQPVARIHSDVILSIKVEIAAGLKLHYCRVRRVFSSGHRPHDPAANFNDAEQQPDTTTS